MMSDGGPPPSEAMWQQVLAADFAKVVWRPLARDLAAQPGRAALLNDLAGHAAAYAALARAWTRPPSTDADSTGPTNGDAPIRALQQCLLQPWLALLSVPDTSEPAASTPSQHAFGCALETLLRRLPSDCAGPEQVAEVRCAVLDFLDALQAYLGIWADIIGTALARLESELSHADSVPDTLRVAYDQWVDIAEQVYAECAITSAFAKVQGLLINRYVRLCRLERSLRLAPTSRARAVSVDAQAWQAMLAELQRQLARMRTMVTTHAAARASDSPAAGNAPAPAGPRATA